MKKNLVKDLVVNNQGFFNLEMVILVCIVLSISTVWLSLGVLINQQRNNGYRTTAIFLAQGYINLMEINQEDKIPDEVIYNGMKYKIIAVDKDDIKSNVKDLEVTIKWDYNHEEQSEYQKRTIYPR